MKAQSTLKLLVLLSLTATLAACGQAGDNSADLASRTPGTNTGSGSSKPVAICNKASGSGMTAQLKAAYNSTTGQYRFDSVLMKISNVGSNFVSGTDYINLWRWMANPTSTYLDQVPLNFYVYDTVTNQYITGQRSAVSWAELSPWASKWGVSAEGLFQRIAFIVDVRDANGEFDALKITTYTSSGSLSSSMDMLLPLYYANPADYAYESNGTARASVLQNLHPLKSMAGQGWSSSQFQSVANSYCF